MTDAQIIIAVVGGLVAIMVGLALAIALRALERCDRVGRTPPGEPAIDEPDMWEGR